MAETRRDLEGRLKLMRQKQNPRAELEEEDVTTASKGFS
ncbi:uncharacterized protein G2W53_023986 [Senna tora]|uniref:Uncharacterized protein n=1 Tax=Senna tora TaxID=362788 RepID=A0A834TC35_9FABA|nr:uncharacterized protein G2W53_023980 [Senna tora]KAF7818531.1 uncharacterized protein G2W53_023986 [Senna tora]